ncbi:hypothetical protein AWB81_08318 [Caballeronia arationis]|nr:hypothetical protein AWB81_08318 [Caballeronia arationis]
MPAVIQNGQLRVELKAECADAARLPRLLEFRQPIVARAIGERTPQHFRELTGRRADVDRLQVRLRQRMRFENAFRVQQVVDLDRRRLLRRETHHHREQCGIVRGDRLLRMAHHRCQRHQLRKRQRATQLRHREKRLGPLQVGVELRQRSVVVDHRLRNGLARRERVGDMNLVPTIALPVVQDRARVAEAEPARRLVLQQLEQIEPATAALSRLFVGLRHLIRREQIQRLPRQIESQIEQLPVLAPDLPRLERRERRSEVSRVDFVDERQEKGRRRPEPTNGELTVEACDGYGVAEERESDLCRVDCCHARVVSQETEHFEHRAERLGEARKGKLIHGGLP